MINQVQSEYAALHAEKGKNYTYYLEVCSQMWRHQYRQIQRRPTNSIWNNILRMNGQDKKVTK